MLHRGHEERRGVRGLPVSRNRNRPLQRRHPSRRIFSEQDRYVRLEVRIERTKKYLEYLGQEFAESSLSRASVNKFDVTAKSLVQSITAGFEDQAERILANARIAFKRA